MFLALIASLALQDVEIAVPDGALIPEAEAQEASEGTAEPAAIAADALELRPDTPTASEDTPAPNAGDAMADDVAESAPPPLPTDAETLIAQIEGGYTAWAGLEAELAARKARERLLAELLLPVVARTDLDDGAATAILTETRSTIASVEDANTGWAIDQLDAEQFAILWAERPRAGADILRWAERDPESGPVRAAALLPIAENGGYDGAAYAELADLAAIAESGLQVYGTQESCLDGQRDLIALRDTPDLVDEARAAIGLDALEADWAARLNAGGETCSVNEEAD